MSRARARTHTQREYSAGQGSLPCPCGSWIARATNPWHIGMDSKRPSERRNWPCARAGAAELSVLARVRRAVPLAVLVLVLVLAGAGRGATGGRTGTRARVSRRARTPSDRRKASRKPLSALGGRALLTAQKQS